MQVHLGCGSKFIPGMTHVDIADFPHIDHQAKVEDLNFLEDNSCDLVYASHVLEHFGRFEYKTVLLEWFRVLRVGGVLRLAVPDFEACARLYYERGLEDGLSGLIGLICGGQRNLYDYHKMVFDETLLTRVLQDTGFQLVRRWNWREKVHAEIDDYSQAYLPHLDKENGTLMSLNIEAVK